MNRTHTSVGGLKPRRNVFDLSYRKNFTCDMGQLIPVMCDECVPGDSFSIGNEVVIRFQPLAAPIMHEITATVHYFFVPYRLLWDEWEKFISPDWYNSEHVTPIPIFNPGDVVGKGRGQIGRLWDYFGMPIQPDGNPANHRVYPIAFPWYAYNKIWNEFYRDENLQNEIFPENNHVLNRNWRKDYFTSALPFRQKGVPPALPVNVQLGWNEMVPGVPNPGINQLRYGSQIASYALQELWPNLGHYRHPGFAMGFTTSPGGALNQGPVTLRQGDTPSVYPPELLTLGVDVNDLGSKLVGSYPSDRNYGLAAEAATFNVSDLRLAFQLQKWLERNARGGTRYTEFLRAHFGVSPTDARLDRPEYIGGTKTPIIISEVLQTSQTVRDTPNDSMLAQMGGHGLAANGSFAGKYHVQEFGLIMGLLSVMPKPAYQQGINRQWLRTLPTDFYFPEFCRLSEQAIYNCEVYDSNGLRDDKGIFGYTGQYDEMRIKHDMVAGQMRKLEATLTGSVGTDRQLSFWNLARSFVPSNMPNLNTEFITCVPRKDIFLAEDQPGLIVNISNLIRAVRPLPTIADPGLVDHY